MAKNKTLDTAEIVYPKKESRVKSLSVFAENRLTMLPYSQLDKQGMLVFSAIIKNSKDKEDEVITITASELSRITGIKDKPRIHKRLFEITERFKEINTLDFVGMRDGVKYSGFVSLFDTFIFPEEYNPNFELQVRLGQTFRGLVNGLGGRGSRYFNYDINVMRLLPARSFDSLLYILLSAESVKSKHGVIITKDDFVNKLGVPVSKVDERHSGTILKKGLTELEKQGVIKKGFKIEKINQGAYKVYYTLVEADKTLLDYEEKNPV